MRRWPVLLFVLLAIAGAWMFRSATAAQPPRSLEPQDTVLDAAALAAGDHDRTRPAGDGLTAESGGGAYATPPQQVTPFSDLLVSWRADVPLSATLTVSVRTSADGQSWSPWAEIEESHDLFDERDSADQHWGAPVFAGKAAWWQFRAEFAPAPDGRLATLREVRVSTVDVGALPDPGAGADETASAASTVDKPPVISRTGWGSPDGQGSRARPAYYPVTHLVVHHTADSNVLGSGQTWWGDRVRAIWSFHTFTRGWGDIGYNYLVAPTGQIFEGRAGGDNAVAFHDTGNYGSMGVSMIGTYDTVAPTAAAQTSLVNLLAWKASQRGIDALGSSYYYGCDISRYCGNPGAVTGNITGHRGVANNPVGYTECPGDRLWDLLPSIRSRVKALVGGAANPDNGDMTIDDLESSFIRSNAEWYESACGDGGHIFYTFATDNPEESTNRGIWRKEGLSAGDYRIYVHIPQNCNLGNLTEHARYTIWQGGQQIGAKEISQDTTTEWVEITTGPLAHAALPVEVHLTDVTGEPLSAQRKIIFDTVRWVKEVPQASVSLVQVAYERTVIAGGELLKATFTVRNTGNVPVKTQAPEPGSPSDPRSGYTYDERECFLSDSQGSYPAFPKESGRFRVMLGGDGLGDDCAGATGGYPWRWGLGGDLAPGETREIVGYVRFQNVSAASRQVTVRAGLINEYVAYVDQNRAQQTLTILPENDVPLSSLLSGQHRPQAIAYELDPLPDDFLARTANPLSIPDGRIISAFDWDGSRIDWGEDGPNHRADFFVVRQTRTFVAPVDGAYRFQLTSDDGAWLWIDGTLVAETHGLHPERETVGERWLSAGEHTLSFKYFERTAQAVMSYYWETPGSGQWSAIPFNLGGDAARAGTIYGPGATISVAAEDQGGAGISHIRWSLDGQTWSDQPGRRLTLTPGGGAYTLRYAAVDEAGNAEPVRELSWRVDAAPPTSRISQAGLTPGGAVRLTLQGSDAMSGVAAYEVEARDHAGGGWRVVYRAAGTSAAFFGEPGHTYDLRVRAVDLVGNWEAAHAAPDVTGITVPAGSVFHRQFAPLLGR